MTKKPDPRRQMQGAVARELGKSFEARIDLSLRWYRAKGLALVEKTPEPMRVIRSIGGGRFEACFEHKAQPDYSGVVRGGLAVAFEAKYTTTEKMEQSRVLPHQADWFDQFSRAGGRCFVMVGFRGGAIYRVPWEVWSDMAAIFGRKYIKETDIQAYRVRETKRGVLKVL